MTLTLLSLNMIKICDKFITTKIIIHILEFKLPIILKWVKNLRKYPNISRTPVHNISLNPSVIKFKRNPVFSKIKDKSMRRHFSCYLTKNYLFIIVKLSNKIDQLY